MGLRGIKSYNLITQHHFFNLVKSRKMGSINFSYNFFQAERPQHFWLVGLSASAAEAYEFKLVRPSVRVSVRPSVTAYLENRASDFDDFLHKATS